MKSYRNIKIAYFALPLLVLFLFFCPYSQLLFTTIQQKIGACLHRRSKACIQKFIENDGKHSGKPNRHSKRID